MSAYHQNILIDRINQYFKLNHRDLKFDYGYCHGIALYWLYCMATDKEDWFYNTTHQLAECVTENDFETLNPDIEKFISHIEWLQNSRSYDFHLNQLDVGELLESTRPVSLSFLFSPELLTETLSKIIHSNEMITISGPTHTIGVFKKNNQFHLFDSNYSKGYARIFTDFQELANEMIDRLIWDNKDLKGLSPLEINVSYRPEEIQKNTSLCTDKDKEAIYDSFLSQTTDLNYIGMDGLTNLYLACESGDAYAVRRLLEAGVSTNRSEPTRMSPLELAASSGYHEVVSLLLNHHPIFEPQQHQTPLHYAVKAGHLECVILLLPYQLKIHVTNPKSTKLLQTAMAKTHWLVVCYLIATMDINIKKMLTWSELRFLSKHKKDLVIAERDIHQQLTEEQRQKLHTSLNIFCPMNDPNYLFSKPTKIEKKSKPSLLTRMCLKSMG